MRRYDGYPGWYGYRRRGPGGGRLASFAALIGIALVTLAVLLRAAGPAVPGNGIWPQLALAGVGALLGALVARRAGSASATTVQVWSRRYRRNSGVASFWVLLWKASRWAMLRRSHVWRPSLAAVPWWRRWRIPASSYAVRMARVGALSVYSPIEDVTLRVGGPRTGKSGEIADHIADAPGAVIATSTRLDLLETVGPLRSKQGPVGIFNPSGLGGIASTVHFDPVVGCQHPSTAYARAEDMLGTVSRGDSEREYWVGQARRVLSGLLHAAALGGATMDDVLAWVAAPDTAKATVLGYLRRSPAPAYVADVSQFLSTNDKTRSSITSTIMPALSWLTVDTAVAAASAVATSTSTSCSPLGNRLPAGRRGWPDRAAGRRADRAHRPPGEAAGQRPAARTARPAADARPRRGRAHLPRPAGPVDCRHGRPRSHHPHRRPVPGAARAAVGERGRRGDPQQRRHRPRLRRHPRPA